MNTMKKTMKDIITQLDRIEADAEYFVSSDEKTIWLTIDDFEGFDEHWEEIDRELVDAEAVNEVLNWLKTNADYIDGDMYKHYHFGELDVEVGYTSFDI